jgi:two-component system nitrate/nitrite response regulator NarL
MRVILVGAASDRARLRSQLNSSMSVVGEFASLSTARASDLDADAILIAKRRSGALFDERDEKGSRPLFRDDEAFDEPLTPREIQVLELLAEGLPNKTIAARLGISDQTVKFHVASISGKLGAANRTDAVRRAVRRGLITL